MNSWGSIRFTHGRAAIADNRAKIKINKAQCHTRDEGII